MTYAQAPYYGEYEVKLVENASSTLHMMPYNLDYLEAIHYENLAVNNRQRRLAAALVMQKLWQESNPNGLIYNGVPMDGVEYQKAIRAEWERE